LREHNGVLRWEGRIEQAEEVPALFKTARPDALIDRIAELHSYAVPAIVAWPIDQANADYAAWISVESGSSTIL
jgi:periplasmic divalent cation tolerance protein